MFSLSSCAKTFPGDPGRPPPRAKPDAPLKPESSGCVLSWQEAACGLGPGGITALGAQALGTCSTAAPARSKRDTTQERQGGLRIRAGPLGHPNPGASAVPGPPGPFLTPPRVPPCRGLGQSKGKEAGWKPPRRGVAGTHERSSGWLSKPTHPPRPRADSHQGARYSQQRLLHQGIVCTGRQGQRHRAREGPGFFPRLPHRGTDTGAGAEGAPWGPPRASQRAQSPRGPVAEGFGFTGLQRRVPGGPVLHLDVISSNSHTFEYQNSRG